jgi:hypothetical protein
VWTDVTRLGVSENTRTKDFGIQRTPLRTTLQMRKLTKVRKL